MDCGVLFCVPTFVIEYKTIKAYFYTLFYCYAIAYKAELRQQFKDIFQLPFWYPIGLVRFMVKMVKKNRRIKYIFTILDDGLIIYNRNVINTYIIVSLFITYNIITPIIFNLLN